MTVDHDKTTLKAVARTLRSSYIKAKSKVLGRTYRPSQRHDRPEYWQNAAELCLTMNAAPEDFIKAAFLGCSMKAGPFANMLFGKAARRWYEEYRFSIVGDEESETREEPTPLADELFRQEVLTTRKMMFHAGGTYSVNDRNIIMLRLPGMPFSPVVRVLVTWPDARIMADYGAQAVDFFKRNPHCVSVARELRLPVDGLLKWGEENGC